MKNASIKEMVRK